MRKMLLALALLAPAYALAFDLPKVPPKLQGPVKDATKKAGDTAKAQAKDAINPLTHDEGVTFCAWELPRQLSCKEDWCTAMVEVRTAQDPHFKGLKDATALADMRTKCLAEIATDAGGDDKARKTKCEGWAKERGDMPMNHVEADAMKACWTKPTCGEKVDCWKPKFATVMATAMAKKDGGKSLPAPKK